MNYNSQRRERRSKSLKRSSVIVSVIFIIAIIMFIVPNKNLISISSGTTLYVGGSGFGNYSSIQDAIDNASAGYTVFVYNGKYHEYLVVNKTINLTGEDRDNTIIYWEKGAVVQITADQVNITGFTVKGAPTGIKVVSDNNTILNNILSYNVRGIHLSYSKGNNITANRMLGVGIHIIGDLLEHWNTHNIDASNTVNGLPVYYWKNQTGGTIPPSAGQVILANCTNVKIENQRFTNCSVGIALGFSSNNNIKCNTASTIWMESIFLSYSNENNITGNIASNNYNFHGIHLNASSRNNITNNTLYSNFWGGIYLDYSDGNYIMDNYASLNGGGIWLSHSSKNIIENNTCYLNVDDGIRLEYSNRNNIFDNKVSNHGMYGILLFVFCDDNNVIGNSVSNNNLDGINLAVSSGNNITGNTVFSNTRNGIHFHFSNKNAIIGNNVSSNEDYGIYLYESGGIKVIGNDILSNNYEGLYLWHSSDNDIIKNNIWSNKNGVYLNVFSNNNMITTNNISSNNYDGILLELSSNNIITGNNISDNLEGMNLSTKLISSPSNNNIILGNNVSNNDYGIRLFSSSYNTLTGNNVSSNNQDGLYLLSSSNWNSLIGNTVFSNTNYGIFINASSNNSIYHNNILDNINQAYDDTNNGNQWDNGYPSGGNYWSDFDEPSEGAYDDFNGPDQNVLSGDGIVDKGFGGGGGKNPYVIDPDSQDDYPLMGPYKNYMILKQGWNLISIPSIQLEQNLTKVLASIDGLYDAVQWCDITDMNDPWKHYRPGKPYGNDLFQIKETMGFWIHIIPPGDTIFYYNGIKPSQNQKITLYPGWNMVGYPSLSNKIRTTALNNINFGSDVDSIWAHDAATQKWEEIDASDYFELGRGYWVHSKVTKVWDVPL